LKEAGYPNGFSASLWATPVQRPYNPNGRRVAELIQADLAKIGIETEIMTFEWGEYISRGRKGEHDLYLIGWIADFGDPDNLLRSMWSCAALEKGINFSRLCDERLDSVLREAKHTTDLARRTELYRQAQVLFHEMALAVPLAHSVQFTPLRREVEGFLANPTGIVQFHKADLK
jgi:dipeptide transport system substrate-binding protein